MKQKKSKNIKKEKKRFSFVRLIIFLLLGAFVASIIFLTYKLYTFKLLVSPMFSNTPSSVFDTNNTLIAQIGSERNRENIEFNDIPKQLINAYISIEDERFYSHFGVDIKRTGAAILSYITKRWLLFFWWKHYNSATC